MYSTQKSEKPSHSLRTNEAEERLIYGASKILPHSAGVINIARQNLADI